MSMNLRSTLLAACGAALLAAAPAGADTTTLLRPPARTPVTIPGSGLKQGESLSRGQILMRRLTVVRQGKPRTVRLRCPSGTTHQGLGTFEGVAPDVGFFVLGGNYIGDRSVRVRAFAANGTPRNKVVRSSIFALCET